MAARIRALLPNLALAVGSLVLALALAEAVLSSALPGPTYTWRWTRAARAQGLPFDLRTETELVRDLRRSDPAWVPLTMPRDFVDDPLLVDGDTVQPLGSVALRPTVVCNETGRYLTFRTDAFGHRNPRRSAVSGASARFVHLGDSFAAGDCVQAGFVEQLRRRFPGTRNLALRGNGPLVELATLREYVDSAEVGFWVYYEGNDLWNLERERASPILTRYVADPDYSQRIRARRSAIDEALRERVDRQLAAAIAGRPRVFPHLRAWLYQIRTHPIRPTGPLEPDLDLFADVLGRARGDALARGAELAFVYIPEPARILRLPYPTPSGAHARSEVLSIADSLDLEVLDLTEAFVGHDPAHWFPLGVPGHFNEAGYAVVADRVSDWLEGR